MKWRLFVCLLCLAEGEKKQQPFLHLVFLFSDWKVQASTEKKIKFEFVDSKEGPNVPYFDI